MKHHDKLADLTEGLVNRHALNSVSRNALAQLLPS